jgi:hypothetical protein
MTRDAVQRRLPQPPVHFIPSHGHALGVLGRRLTDCLELRTLIRRLKEDLRGSPAIGLRQELKEIEADIVEYTDLLAGRIAQLGPAGDEAIGLVGMHSGDHGASLSAAIAGLVRTMRGGSEELGSLGDAESAGLLAEVSRVAGTWLWRLELPDGPAPAGRVLHMVVLP